MTEKIGRNDPCPCGSQKKYKQCCLKKVSSRGHGGLSNLSNRNIKVGDGGRGLSGLAANKETPKRKMSAVWVNKPVQEPVNLMDRTFGNAISELTLDPPSFITQPSVPEESIQDENISEEKKDSE